MDQRVQIALGLMREDLRRELSADKLAEAVNLSPSRFRHIFKAETRTSPARYLHLLRLEHARELLETSLLSVKQVMSSVGIADRSHFDREFKRAYGLTPVQYRAVHPLIRPQEQARDVH
jgi:AraC family transcriptional regulator of arabinose operon